MSKRFNLKSAVLACTADDWSSAGKWLAYTLGAGLLPLILGLLLAWGLPLAPFNWREFVVHGEFAIFTAAMIAGALRLISKDTDSGPFVHREMFALVALLILTLSVALYVAITTAAHLSAAQYVNGGFVVWGSFVLLVVAILFSFFVNLLDHQRFRPNLGAFAKQQQQRLENDFDRLTNDHGDEMNPVLTSDAVEVGGVREQR